MKTYLLTIASLLYLSIGAQQRVVAQTRIADYTFGGNDLEGPVGSVITADGGLLTASSTSSTISGEVTQASPAPVTPFNIDFWIVKTNAQGVKQWDKRYGGAGDDRLVKIVAAPNGGYFLCGWSTSGTGFDKSEPSQGLTDYWVVKIDALGNKLWDKRFGTQTHDFLYAAVASPDGGCLLVGNTGNTSIAPDGDRTQPLLGNSDVWMVKVDALGNKQWDKRLGGNSDDVPFDVVTAPGGGFILGIWTLQPSFNTAPGGDVTGSGNGLDDYWVVKIDATGSKVWDRLYGGSGRDFIRALLATPDGGVLVSGESSSPMSGDKSIVIPGKACWVLKLDGQGVKQWDQVFGGSPTLRTGLPKLALDPRGGYYLGASIGLPPDCCIASNYIPDDYLVVNMDANGQQRWEATFGGDGSEGLNAIVPLTNNEVMLVGGSDSNISRDKTSNSRGGSDIWMVKVGAMALGTKSQNAVLNSTASIFPNPITQGALIVEVVGLREQKTVRAEIMNSIGQVVQVLDLPVYQNTIHQQLELVVMPIGVYLLRLHTSEGIITKQLIKN
jgi:hypothetical protein